VDPTLLLLLQILAKYGPDIYREAVKLLKKTSVTLEDLAALDDLLQKQGKDYFAV